jgi:hypothetical protein
MGGGREARWQVGASLLLRAAAAIGTLKVIFLRRWPLPSRAPPLSYSRISARSPLPKHRGFGIFELNIGPGFREQAGASLGPLDGRQLDLEVGRTSILHLDRHLRSGLRATGGPQSRQHGTTGVGECRTSARVEGRTVHAGIWKDPVHRRCRVGRLNLEGDGQGDLAGHGGEQRAVWAIKSKRLTIGRSS